MLCYYITGHGFGHAIRTTQILKALPSDVPLILKTTAPERLFREELPGRDFEYLSAEYDCGCLQSDSVTVLKRETHLPVVVDPTHGIGLREHVPAMALAAVAAGADALMVEVHNSPEMAKSDGEQALLPDDFTDLVNRVRAVAVAVGRDV